jgi:hypothetical protein
MTNKLLIAFLGGFFGSIAVEIVSLVNFFEEEGELPERYRKKAFSTTTEKDQNL